MSPRRGSTLIVVAGISALFLSLSLVFITRMRSDAAESQMVQQEAQARLMLNAALHYIQESSRLGWDDPDTPEHEEAFGWVDIRNGKTGPRSALDRDLAIDDETHAPLTAHFPVPGFSARCPMFMLERPPYALRTAYAYNPAPRDATPGWAELVSMAKPDPQPAASTWSDFAAGDPRPRMESLDLSWFRAYRHVDDPGTPQDERATFTITCGAGATHGFRDWDEVVQERATAEFGNDPSLFYALRNQERLLFYRAEWTSAVGGSSAVARASDSYDQVPVNGTGEGWWSVRGFVGSFLYIERLDHQPQGNAW